MKLELLWQVLEFLSMVAVSAGAAGAVVKRVMTTGLGRALSEALSKSLAELVAKGLEAERPKLLEALRSELRALVLEETEDERQKLAHAIGRLDTLEKFMAQEMKRHG